MDGQPLKLTCSQKLLQNPVSLLMYEGAFQLQKELGQKPFELQNGVRDKHDFNYFIYGAWTFVLIYLDFAYNFSANQI